MKQLACILIAFIAVSGASAQEGQPAALQDTFIGKVVIHRDVRIDTLVQRVIKANEKKPTIRGYRIQIYSGSSRSKANQIKATFLVQFPGESIFLLYRQPNFKIRVGNYRNRIEAMYMYYQLLESEDFRYVLLVPDEIFLPALTKN